MNKIKITNEQFNKLVKLQALLPVTDDTSTMSTTAENMLEAKNICAGINFSADDLYDKIQEAENYLYDKDLDSAIESMSKYVELIKELQADVNGIANLLAGSVTELINATEISTFTVTATNEEIQTAIDESFNKCSVMSIGFKDGIYALLFGENEESIDLEPFVFATGKEADYEAARQFIEGFLDLEDID